MILSPTRELAQQTEQVSHNFGSPLGLGTVCVYGGSSRHVQIKKLSQRNVDIIVATPGRIIDLHECGNVALDSCDFVVLDEADRMLDMGFEPQIRDILQNVAEKRQMLMWSATWPNEVRDLANDLSNQENLVHLNIGSTELQANPNIEQVVELTQSEIEKKEKLKELLLEEVESTEKVLIFAATKRSVDYLEHFLSRNGIRAMGIHGDKSQQARDRVLFNFRQGRRNVLIATDVASRGLDVDDVKLVINYDFPKNIEDYVHR